MCDWRQSGSKQWYAEMELEPLPETGLTENFRVKVGDDVVVDSDEDNHSYVVRVTELFRDESKLKVTGNLYHRSKREFCVFQTRCYFKGRWFYRLEDTLLMVTSEKGTSELPLDREIGRRWVSLRTTHSLSTLDPQRWPGHSSNLAIWAIRQWRVHHREPSRCNPTVP